MKLGIVYLFKPYHKINGTLFYCYEYLEFLKKFYHVSLYLVNITKQDLELVHKLFQEKYTTGLDDIKSIGLFDLYRLNLDRTLVLDIHSFYSIKEFLTNDVLVFSNDQHPVFRYKNSRTVTYYGVYDYQPRDKTTTLKLNFDIFRTSRSQSGTFFSSRHPELVRTRYSIYEQRGFPKPFYFKSQQHGLGDIFDLIDHVHYVHTTRDTNNRIIPETFFHDKKFSIDNEYRGLDSVRSRLNDCQRLGPYCYQISIDDQMIQDMLCNV